MYTCTTVYRKDIPVVCKYLLDVLAGNDIPGDVVRPIDSATSDKMARDDTCNDCCVWLEFSMHISRCVQ